MSSKVIWWTSGSQQFFSHLLSFTWDVVWNMQWIHIERRYSMSMSGSIIPGLLCNYPSNAWIPHSKNVPTALWAKQLCPKWSHKRSCVPRKRCICDSIHPLVAISGLQSQGRYVRLPTCGSICREMKQQKMIGFGVPDLTLMDTSKKENKKEANQKFFKTCWDDIQKTKIHDTCILHYIVDINILCTSYAQFSDTLSYVHSLHFSQKQHARCRGAFSWAGVLLKKNRNRVTNGPTTTSRMTSHPQATHLDGCQEATPNRSPQGLADLLYLLLHLLSTKADLQREKIPSLPWASDIPAELLG